MNLDFFSHHCKEIVPINGKLLGLNYIFLKVKYEATEDVYTSRKKQHQTTMHYFCALNTLQYKKKIAMLEPLLGYMQAQVNFKMHGEGEILE